MPQEGMLLQLDGSHHLWLEDRGPWLTLLLAVDDATGTVPYALIQEQEDTRGYLSLLQGIIERQGVPMAVYTDRHAVFQSRRSPADRSPVRQKGPSTQWGRALGELGITQILAHSPRPKDGWRGPALASELRARTLGGPVMATPPDPDPTDWEPKQRVRALVTPGPLAGETIWYEDPTRKQVHRDLVVAGMERARQQGKRIGRPRVSERPEFEQLYTKVLELLGSGGLSRRQAARELGIGYATLKRLLDSNEKELMA